MRLLQDITNTNTQSGSFAFGGRFSGSNLADFLLGMASQYTWSTRIQVNLRSWNVGAFVQDDWKITRNLTLNLGVRYEVVLPFIDQHDRMGIFDDWTDPNKPVLIPAGSLGSDRYNRAMFATDKNNFMPRAGFAYKLGPRTVIRSGYGIFYSYLEPYGDAEYLIGNPPGAFGVVISSSPTVPALLLAQGPAPGALAPCGPPAINTLWARHSGPAPCPCAAASGLRSMPPRLPTTPRNCTTTSSDACAPSALSAKPASSRP